MIPLTAPPEIEKAFQTTFKLIFGECNLKLDDLGDYLFRWHYPSINRKSSVSGKEVIVSSSFYPDDANFISNDEIDFTKKSAPLGINEIKDLDSIIETLKERDLVYYAGNKIFGNSSNLYEVDNCTDTHYAYKSHNIASVKYVAHSSYVRHGSEYVFGSGWFLRSGYLIRVIGADSLTRAFESYLCASGSDVFFSFNCFGCSHLMFSFNQRSKRYCIGNIELPKDKYFALREKLITESREYIERNKSFYSIFDVPPVPKERKMEMERNAPKPVQREENLTPIDESFRATCRVIFGQEIGPLLENRDFLVERVILPEDITTVYGNPACYVPVFLFKDMPKYRMIMRDEEQEAAKMVMDAGDGDNLESVIKKLGQIAFFRIDMSEGNITNVIKSPLIYHGINAYYVGDLTFGKNCAYCTYALNDEAVFGCHRCIYSKFCIRCENSVNLTACFEMDACTNCANSMFCHNCENLDNCMFCFNTKSKKYAIANVEVGREEYMKIRERVLAEIVKQIKGTQRMKWNIYNIR